MTNRRALIGVVAVLMLMTMGSAAFARQGAATSKDEADVRKAELDRFAAMVKADVAALEKLLANELVYTHGDARRIDKAAFIADFKTGAFKYTTIEPNEIVIKVYGDTAVVTGGAAMRVVQNGTTTDIKIRYTNLQVRKSGAWQMVAWQATRIPAP